MEDEFRQKENLEKVINEVTDARRMLDIWINHYGTPKSWTFDLTVAFNQLRDVLQKLENLKG